MYQIFINEKPFFLVQEKKGSAVRGHIVLHEPRLENLSQWAKRLEEDGALLAVYAIVKDPKKCFESFSSVYRNIDAAGGLVTRNEEILFIKRFGKWDLPKGKVEKGEAFEAAAVREVEEECGVNNLQLNKYIATTYHTYQFQGTMALKHSHWYAIETTFQGTPVPQLEEGITEVRWFTKAELPTVLANTYASIATLIQYWINAD